MGLPSKPALEFGISATFASLMLNPQDLNPYVYVGNNPVNFADPLGLGYPETCQLLKGNCMGLCNKCGIASEEYVFCLNWCRTIGWTYCIAYPGKGKYPENPYCKDDKEQCEDKR